MAKNKNQIFDKKSKPATYVLVLTDGRKGRKGRKGRNIKTAAILERLKGKINKIILIFPVDNKTNLFYNKDSQGMTGGLYV